MFKANLHIWFEVRLFYMIMFSDFEENLNKHHGYENHDDVLVSTRIKTRVVFP